MDYNYDTKETLWHFSISGSYLKRQWTLNGAYAVAMSKHNKIVIGMT